MLSISAQTRRRYILGKQGLWQGRRWQGKNGAEQALRYSEAVQIDPVSVVAQSHDIMLWGRVIDYQPAYLRELMYEDRKFFDHGGLLMIYPMDELPYWRVIMERQRLKPRWTELAETKPDLIKFVRQQVRERGPLRGRDFKGNKVAHYRSSKDTGVALYYLWITGEMMTHHRHGKERVYDFLENIAPPHLQHTASVEESENYFAHKTVAHHGFVNTRSFKNVWRGHISRTVDLGECKTKLAQMEEQGLIAELEIEGEKESHYVLAADLSLLDTLQRGKTPGDWQPIAISTEEEVTFLSPLEYVSARKRAAGLFSFNYIWEIYKPDAKRVYGPYTLPILYGDQLVARVDARLDRANHTLIINGFWLEDWFEADDRFANALAKGFVRFLLFLSAEQLDTSALKPRKLKQHIDKIVAAEL